MFAIVFVIVLLWRVVVSSTVDFLVSFYVDSLYDKVQSDKVIRLNHILQFVIDMKS